MSKISLLYQNSDIERGPSKVANNLKKGLENLGHTVNVNKIENNLIGCLQVVENMEFLPDSTVFGPNLFVLPSDFPKKIFEQRIKHLVCPSNWVKNIYQTFSQITDNNVTVDVWSVGIETNLWIKSENKEKKFGILYVKNRGERDVYLIKKLLEKSDVQYQIFEYGNYKEEELFAACKKASFAVLLTSTESQGIAYMQILSCDIPCYVFNKTFWDNEGKSMIKYPASSVPYFSEECGMLAETVSISHFKEFLSKLDSFSPRKYILENHTLEQSAEKYLNILLKYQT